MSAAFHLADHPDVELEKVSRVSQAQFAVCEECDTSLGCQYWPLAKSVHLHKAGTGHDVTLLRFK